MNSFYSGNPFLFSEFSSFSSHLKAGDSEFSFWYQHSDSSLFFDLFRYSTQSRFKERVPSFNEYSFNFSFLFDDGLHVEWNASVWFNGFSGKWLWMFMIVSVRMLTALLMMLIGSVFSYLVRVEIWYWRVANWLEREELTESQLALW